MAGPALQLRRQQYKHPFGFEMGTLNPETVVEVLNYLFNTTAWKHQPELVTRKVKAWRERLFIDGPGSIGRGATPPPQTHSLFAPVPEPVIMVADEPEDDGTRLPWETPEPEAWIEEAIALRQQEPPMGWERIALTLKRPKTTVRRVVGDAMRDRGIEVG